MLYIEKVSQDMHLLPIEKYSQNQMMNNLRKLKSYHYWRKDLNDDGVELENTLLDTSAKDGGGYQLDIEMK